MSTTGILTYDHVWGDSSFCDWKLTLEAGDTEGKQEKKKRTNKDRPHPCVSCA